MLKTDVIEFSHEMKFIFHGKLVEPWVSEVRTVWMEKLEKLEKQDHRKIIVDLREMTGVDSSGIDLLLDMHNAGAGFRTSGVLSRFLVDSFRKKRKANS